VDLVPDASLVPGRKAPAAGHARAEAKLLGQVLPLDDSVQGGLPSTFLGPGFGSNGSINDHSSSDTIHGRD
jgi:hypothetical protein